jgi:hypothetical protein
MYLPYLWFVTPKSITPFCLFTPQIIDFYLLIHSSVYSLLSAYWKYICTDGSDRGCEVRSEFIRLGSNS